MQIFIHKQIKS